MIRVTHSLGYFFIPSNYVWSGDWFAPGLHHSASFSSVHSPRPRSFLRLSSIHGVPSKLLLWAPSAPRRQKGRRGGRLWGMGRWRCWWGMEERVRRTVFPECQHPLTCTTTYIHEHAHTHTHTHTHWNASSITTLPTGTHTPAVTHICCQSIHPKPPAEAPLWFNWCNYICIRLSRFS